VFRRRKSAPERPRRRIRKLRFLALFAVLGLAAAVSFTYGLVVALAGELPQLEPGSGEELVPQNGYIYASDGRTILAVLRGPESRVPVESEQIAPVMKQAIVAVEDRRFWEHRGIDIRGVVRAVWADVRNQEVVQGGSTITQQFIKNTYVTNERTISRKLKEAALAWQLERRWTKDRILTAYLNTIYFGNGAYGIQQAAKVYFGKSAVELTLAEAALLAGIPANPAAYDPVARPKSARVRRLTVLNLMRAQGLVSTSELVRGARVKMPKPEDVRLPGIRGPAQYFVEYVKQQLIPYYGSGEVFGGGLKVYTSIDLRLQQQAKDAIDKWLTKADGPAAALVAMDPRDGRILAMVGGSSFSKSQFNLAVQGERQPGSAFKPFVLAAALRQGIATQTTFVSKPTVVDIGDRLWSVRNYEGNYLGRIDLRTATVYSDNAVYAQLTSVVGPAAVRRTASSLGIKSPLQDYFAIGLGAEAVNPLEMARAYATIANGGDRIDGSVLGDLPRAVLRIEDGRKIDSNDPVDMPILRPEEAGIITATLEDVLREGTGRRAGLEDRPAAGKTGTTENYGDAWFVGYTPQLVTAVWVGYPTRFQPMETEFNGKPVAGGTYPALIWKTFAKSALATLGEAPEDFPYVGVPDAGTYTVARREGKWRLDNGSCRDTRQLVFFVNRAPRQEADCKPNEVVVPRVVGAPLGDAETRLASVPLSIEVITRPAEAGEKLGVVKDQFPADGTLSAWDTVKVVVPKALAGVVPDLVGLTLDEARSLLSEDELRAAAPSFAEGPRGLVLSQRPKAGLAAAPKMTVELVVGR
jgi:penicillin-binding protein 1A